MKGDLSLVSLIMLIMTVSPKIMLRQQGKELVLCELSEVKDVKCTVALKDQ